jgi:RNA polymerase sigma-70 factor (ECF subfamily)
VHEKKNQREQAIVPNSLELTAFLVSVSKERDKKAFAILFQHFAPRVKSYVFKLGSDETMAEELAQQTLLQVWRKAHLFNQEKAVASTWIFRIARNLRIDLIRKEKNFDYDDYDLAEVAAEVADESESAETKVDRYQHAMLVQSALVQLPTEQNQIVRLSFYEGLSHGEIATQLNLPLGTVKSRMRLAFKRIRDSIGRVL